MCIEERPKIEENGLKKHFKFLGKFEHVAFRNLLEFQILVPKPNFALGFKLGRRQIIFKKL